MSWNIKGEYYENCSCTNTCPCTWSSMSAPATNDYCRANLAFQISEGEANGVDMSDVTFVLVIDSPPVMAEGNWKVGAYVDERSSQKAYNGILQIFSGQAGGTTALFTMLVSEIIGASREKVEIVREGNKRSINIGRKISGEIDYWNTSLITDMSSLFAGNHTFNGDISGWDVSNVTDMKWMFGRASSFNQNLSSWDVSNVTDMSYMFNGAETFNSDLSGWDVSNVKNMRSMFYGAKKFTSDLSKWDVSNATNMGSMFEGVEMTQEHKCATLKNFSKNPSWTSDWKCLITQDNIREAVDGWSSDSVSTQSIYGHISNWDVSNVTDMSSLFEGQASFNSDLSEWNVSNVTDMKQMFEGCEKFNKIIRVGVSSICVSK